jgi:hypothetical protein
MISNEKSGMVDLSGAGWEKSQFSNNGGDCVEWTEVGAPDHAKAGERGVVVLRDSKDPEGGVLVFSHSEMSAWVRAAKAGQLDRFI